MYHQFGRLREWLLGVLAFVVLAAAGCIPEEEWLLDSSGFVYSVGKDYETQEIQFYDIARRAELVVWTGSNQAASIGLGRNRWCTSLSRNGGTASRRFSTAFLDPTSRPVAWCRALDQVDELERK